MSCISKTQVQLFLRLRATQLEAVALDHTNNSLHIQSVEDNLWHRDLQMGAGLQLHPILYDLYIYRNVTILLFFMLNAVTSLPAVMFVWKLGNWYDIIMPL